MPTPGSLPVGLLLASALLAWAGAPPQQPFVQRPLETLIAEARATTPPAWPRSPLTPDLVDLTALDPTIRLDVRYASKDNFIGAPVYREARAFLQRPVAEALVRVNRGLQRAGFALRVHDAYRPWWVTKVFWEATPPGKREFVADPAKGSVHNRGCAVDLDLVRLPDGAPAAMPSDYDEMSERAYADYAGGPAEPRRNRDVLRAAMEAEGFRVLKEEWWHYDHASSAGYPVLNLPFEAILGPRPEVARAGQLLLVTTPDWDAPKGRLQRFERRGGALVAVGAPWPVWVGKAGLAWKTDEGAPPPPGPGPLKREGDGRSPAGILTFGDLWGYAPQPPEGVRLPYRAITDCDRCVDDPDHADYNRLVRLPSPQAPVTWRSAERLLMATEHYRHLVVIHYNDLRPRKGAGSCIFLHVAPPPGGGTAGCTALAVEDLLTLLQWMDPAKRPVLLQVPESMLETTRATWSLPPELKQAGR